MSGKAHRPSAEIRAELDQINRKRRAIDQQIEARRRDLAALNAKVPDLEREFQASVAAEQQAALTGKTPDTPTH